MSQSASKTSEQTEAFARKILLDLLASRARSRSELEKRLAARNVPTELAQRLLDRFTELGLVDDTAFAQAWASSRHRSKSLGKRALAHELRGKGIADTDVDQALAEITPAQEAAAAGAYVRKRMRAMQRLEPAVVYRRLAAALARKGHSSEVIRSVLAEELSGGDEFAAD